MDLIRDLREKTEEQGVTLIGICAFGISKDLKVDSFIFTPDTKVLAIGDPKERIALAARFVKLAGMSVKAFLERLFASFDLKDVADSIETTVEDAIRNELEHLRTTVVLPDGMEKEDET